MIFDAINFMMYGFKKPRHTKIKNKKINRPRIFHTHPTYMSGRLNFRCSCTRTLIREGEIYDGYIAAGCSDTEALSNTNKRIAVPIVKACCRLSLMTDEEADPTFSSFAPPRASETQAGQQPS